MNVTQHVVVKRVCFERPVDPQRTGPNCAGFLDNVPLHSNSSIYRNGKNSLANPWTHRFWEHVTPGLFAACVHNFSTSNSTMFTRLSAMPLTALLLLLLQPGHATASGKVVRAAGKPAAPHPTTRRIGARLLACAAACPCHHPTTTTTTITDTTNSHALHPLATAGMRCAPAR